MSVSLQTKIQKRLEMYFEVALCRRRLDSGTRSEFEQLVRKVRPEDYSLERGISREKVMEVTNLMRELGFDPLNKSFLDLGAGYGDSRIAWLESGGRDWQYVERSIWFAAHHRISGNSGWRGDHFKLIHKLPMGAFDVVWVKGSMDPDSLYFRSFGRTRLRRWLRGVERLVGPEGRGVVCPYFINIPDGHWAGEVFEELGWVRLPFLEGHNSLPNYRATWVFSK